MILAVVVLATVLTWLDQPSTVTASIWATLSVSILVQAALSVLVARHQPAAFAAAAFAFVLDATVVLVSAGYSPTPLGSSAIVIFFAVVAGFVLPVGWSVTYTIACTSAVTVLSHVSDDWPEPHWFPATAMVTLLSGVAATYMSTRLQAAERDLRREADEHDAAVARLEQVGASRDRLIANVSHELRTPLTSTIGSIETLLREDVELDQAQQDQLLRIARSGGLRLLSLVEDLLTIGSTRPESLDLSTGPEDLVDIVTDAVTGLDTGGDRAIIVDAQEHPLVMVDRLRMLQVATNLVVNAIRHGSGDIEIHCTTSGEIARLEVRDSGPGVPPEHVDELFLPFAKFSGRADSTGLGLAICRTLVDAHDGSIRYVRDDGQTCFQVDLPLAERR